MAENGKFVVRDTVSRAGLLLLQRAAQIAGGGVSIEPVALPGERFFSSGSTSWVEPHKIGIVASVPKERQRSFAQAESTLYSIIRQEEPPEDPALRQFAQAYRAQRELDRRERLSGPELTVWQQDRAIQETNVVGLLNRRPVHSTIAA